MKMIKSLVIFTCLIVSGITNASDLNNNIVGSSQTITSYHEISHLRSQEALLKTILKHSESIQLKDGTVIDLRDIEDGQSSFENGLIEVFKAVEGGGTGAGG